MSRASLKSQRRTTVAPSVVASRCATSGVARRSPLSTRLSTAMGCPHLWYQQKSQCLRLTTSQRRSRL